MNTTPGSSLGRGLRPLTGGLGLSFALLVGLLASVARADFKIVAIPDTQYYTSGQFGGTNAMFTAQTSWIQTNRATQNIAYVACLGDITDHGDSNTSEWANAKAGYDLLESPVSIPWGACVGNHDQTPNQGFPLTDTTNNFNSYFGTAHFSGRAYYGGAYQAGRNDSHYDLFTADGMNFIVIYIEYDSHDQDTANMNTWAYNLLGTYSSRKAIIVSHFIGDGGAPICPFGAQGLGIYNRLKSRPNVFLMLSGHVGTGWGKRQDTYNGKTIKTFVSNYQFNAEGGGGYMRIYTISAPTDSISAVTYSPYHNADAPYKTDAYNQFRVPWLHPRHVSFDGDATTDRSFYNNGTWKAYNQLNFTNGTSTDIPVPADYDGDGITDHAVWRPSTGEWIIPGMATVSYGVAGDIPVPADYDGDGKADLAVYRPASPSGTWHIITSSNGGFVVFTYGGPNDIPVPGDYDGDGKADYALYRPGSPNSTWFITKSSTGVGSSTAYGIATDIPVPGDYDGDGITDIAVYRAGSPDSRWYRLGTSVVYGTSGDIPCPGDYNGDGVWDPAVWRPSTNTFYTNGTTVSIGASGDKVLPLPYAIRKFFFP